MKYNDLINNLLDLLDNNNDIIKVKELKNKLQNDSNFLSYLNNYKLNNSIDNKKKLYENKNYVEYLHSETNINILIQEIKKKFNFVKQGCIK